MALRRYTENVRLAQDWHWLAVIAISLCVSVTMIVRVVVGSGGVLPRLMIGVVAMVVFAVGSVLYLRLVRPRGCPFCGGEKSVVRSDLATTQGEHLGLCKLCGARVAMGIISSDSSSDGSVAAPVDVNEVDHRSKIKRRG